MKLQRQLVFFYFSRFLGLALKPFTLWCALTFHSDTSSEFFAKLFFLVPATFNIFNNDSHIGYYKTSFGGMSLPQGVGFRFRTYLNDFFSHSLLFSVPLFLFFALYFKKPIPAFLFLLFTLHEKFFDEVLRYQLFAKRYDVWAKCFLIKAGLPLGALILSVVWPRLSSSLSYATLILLGTTLVTKGLFSPRVFHFIKHVFVVAARRRLSQYAKAYRDRYLVNQLATLCAVNLISVDKWVGSHLWDPRTLGEVVLATQFGSIYLVIIDNFFFTTNRDRYVKNSATLIDVISWKKLGGLTVILLTGYWGSLTLVKPLLGFRTLSTVIIISIFLISILKGISRPLEEYVFWHYSRASALVIDASCLILTFFIGKICFSVTEPLFIYLTVLGGSLFRLSCYWLLTRKSEKGLVVANEVA